MSQIKLSENFIKNAVKVALDEDLYPNGDITSDLIIENKIKSIKLISNDKGIVGGLKFAKTTFNIIDKKIKFSLKKKEGSKVNKGDVVALISGNIKNILIGERVALNFISHISGIASKTHLYVKAVNNRCKICCTRKTIPGLRVIQKYAVKLGGGFNHRFNLSDEFLIKDNHIGVNYSIAKIVKNAIQSKNKKKITVEVDNINQLKSILGLDFDRVLLDNMNIKNTKIAIKLCKNKYETEASGGINLKNVKKYASTGVDRISIGNLTHSFNALDFKLEF